MRTFEFSDEPQILRVFNYAPDTREFIGESDCYVAPNTGLPGRCTLEKPPIAPVNTIPIWLDERWQLIEDHRGRVAYDINNGAAVTIVNLGPLLDGVTLTPPSSQFDRWDGSSWRPDITEVKSMQIAAIKAHRDAITSDYIIIDGHHFHSDANSRIQQLSLTKMGQANQIPTGLMWQTKNHGLIELTTEIAARFETETMAHDMRLFATAQHHITVVEALKDVQAILDYDYSQGWQP